MHIKLAAACGGDVREIAGTSAVFLRGVNALHDAYLTGVKANAGKLPVVVLTDTIPVESGSGGQRSTNYQPIFEIVAWAPRPTDMGPGAKTTPAPAATNGSGAARPAATGATVVAPPVKAVAATAAADDDFG